MQLSRILTTTTVQGSLAPLSRAKGTHTHRNCAACKALAAHMHTRTPTQARTHTSTHAKQGQLPNSPASRGCVRDELREGRSGQRTLRHVLHRGHEAVHDHVGPVPHPVQVHRGKVCAGRAPRADASQWACMLGRVGTGLRARRGGGGGWGHWATVGREGQQGAPTPTQRRAAPASATLWSSLCNALVMFTGGVHGGSGRSGYFSAKYVRFHEYWAGTQGQTGEQASKRIGAGPETCTTTLGPHQAAAHAAAGPNPAPASPAARPPHLTQASPLGPRERSACRAVRAENPTRGG